MNLDELGGEASKLKKTFFFSMILRDILFFLKRILEFKSLDLNFEQKM